jgi:hypothetical protein
MAYYSRYVTRMKKVVYGVLLLQLALTWPSWAYRVVKHSLTEVLPCSSLVRSLWLKTTVVSITPTKHTTWCLGYHRPLSLWFHEWLCATVIHYFCQVVVVKADPTQNLFRLQVLISSRHALDPKIKKVIMPMFMPLRSKKWFNGRSLFSRTPLPS